MASAAIVNHMATRTEKPMPEELRKAVDELKEKLLPAIAVLTNNVGVLQVTAAEISAKMELKISRPEMESVRAYLAQEIDRTQRMQNAFEVAQGNRSENHDNRLGEIERSNSRILETLQMQTKAIDNLDKAIAEIVKKVWYILGVGGLGLVVLQYFLRKV